MKSQITPRKGPLPTDETRACIEAAFAELYLTLPFEKISAREVAAVARCSRSTLYRHFANLEELYVHISEGATCSEPCDWIIENALVINLEDATDAIVEFYESRADLVAALVRGSRHEEYLQRQAQVMQPMFQALIARALDLTPRQAAYASELIARNRAEMIRMWIDHEREMSLEQINKMSENLIEKSLWTDVAMQSPSYGGPRPRFVAERHLFTYPWQTKE